MKIIIIMLLALTMFAQEKTEKMVTLQSKVDGKPYILKIDKMDIKVNIIGNIAETSLDITFKNDLDKMIEGTLYLPMKENASIFEYQFEMNDANNSTIMKKGVIVEKEKARVAYEEIVRQKVDPGLLIWSKGNNFKTRIYPINPKSTKRIIVSYQEELTNNFNKDCGGKCPAYIYSLPLSIKYKVSKFSLKVNANTNHIYSMMKNKNRFITDKSGNLTLIDENYAPNENIKLGVFNKNALSKKSIVNVSYNKNKKNWYFTATVFPNKLNIKKVKPKRICLYWDNSVSMKERNLNKEVDFIKSYIKDLGNTNISLINFSNAQEIQGKFVANKGVLPKIIIDKVKNTIYDGGTQLGSINTKKTPNNCQEALIFTDGISNFGNSTPNLTIPTYFINSKLTAEHSYMKYLANKSGGAYINLQNTDTKKAIEIISTQKYKFLSAVEGRHTGRTVFKELWPNTPVEVRDSFTITGILGKRNKQSKSHQLLLRFGLGNKTKETIIINIPIAKERDKNMVLSLHSFAIERQFARHKIAALSKDKTKNKNEIINTSKKHSILTEFTSFLVLETLEDYLKYKIVPPKEMQEKYFQVLENKRQEKEKSLKSHVEIVLRKYNELKKYWSKKHKTEYQIKEEKRKAEIARKKAERERIKRGKEREKARKLAEKEGIKSNLEIVENKVSVSKKEAKMEESMEMDDAKVSSPVLAESNANMRRRATIQKKKSKDKGASSKLSASIQLKAFDPNTPYLKALVKVKKGHYDLYLKLRKDYVKSSSFYLDVSDFFMRKNKKKLALKILSNVAELELENHELLRILGYRLWQLKQYKLAIYVFEEVLKLRPEEPQSHRDLGLTYRSMKEYQKAVNYLYKVATNDWDSRFSDIDLIALYEMNAIIGRVGKKKLDLTKFDKRLIQNLPVDIRVVLSWDANNTDIDLWVTDPYGEKCYYGHKRTIIGGYNTNDFTGGYGPEMFILKKAHKGKYKIQANYYGSSSQNLSGEVTLHLELFLNYGKKNQIRKEIVLRVKNASEVLDIGEFIVNPSKNGVKVK